MHTGRTAKKERERESTEENETAGPLPQGGRRTTEERTYRW